MGKNALYITTRIFWPAIDGHKTELQNHCRALSEMGYSVHICSFASKDAKLEKKPSYISSVSLLESVSKGRILKNLWSVLFRRHWTLQQALMFSPQNFRTIKQLTEKLHPEVIFVDMVRLAPYYQAFAQLSCKKVLNVDDLLSERYRRQLAYKDSSASVLGQYKEEASRALVFFSGVKALKRIALQYEAKKMAYAEVYYSKIFDKVTLVSPIETAKLAKEIGETKAINVPLGIDYEYLSQRISLHKIPDTISFVGNLACAPNIDTLSYMAEQLLPRVAEHNPKIQLRVVGNCPSNIQNQYKDNAWIQFTGRVDDLREAIGSTMAFVAPIAYGTGIKTKVLEAMAMGMPVVTNSIGAEGMNVVDGGELLLAESSDEIAQAIEKLLQSEELRQKLGEQAQEYVKAYHDWREVQKAFGKMGL